MLQLPIKPYFVDFVNFYGGDLEELLNSFYAIFITIFLHCHYVKEELDDINEDFELQGGQRVCM